MTRTSTFGVIGGTLAALALSATAASAETIKTHITTPSVHIQTSHGNTNSANTGGGAGKSVGKQMDSSSPVLYQSTGGGGTGKLHPNYLNPQPLPP